MQPVAAERIGQKVVDHAVALEAALAREGRGYDIHSEMSLSAFPPAGMSGMKMRFIFDRELRRAEFPGHDFGHPFT